MFQHGGDMKRQAHREVLKHLIKMAQGMMMKGLGDSEEAGDKVKEAMHEGGGGEEMHDAHNAGEPQESALGDASELNDDGDENFDDYRKREMKRGVKSPLKDRKTMMIVGVKASPMGGAPRGAKMGK